MKDLMIDLLDEVGERFSKRQVARTEIYTNPDRERSRDVHAFYRLLRDTGHTIHVQGYSGMSTREIAVVRARLMSTDRLVAIGERGGVSIGNEHDAFVRAFPNLDGLTNIPYDPEILDQMLTVNVPLLRATQ